MLELQGNALTFLAFYTESKVGKTGLTVTCTVYEGDTAIVSGASATPIGGGLYYYTLSSGSVDANALYTAIFATATTTVDQQHIPALWVVGRTWTTRIDATISSRSSHSAADVWASATRTLTSYGTLVADIWANATRTLTSFGTLVADIAASINALLSQIIPQDIPPLSSDIELRRGDSWARAITVGSVAGYVSLDWIIKPNTDNPDNRALWWTRKNASGSGDGLLFLNGEAATTAAQGSITVSDAATGALVLNAYSVATAQLAPGDYLYEIQAIYVAGQTATTVASGKFTILADVARATS